ncbi:2-dehydro-3-deoxygalactonokinase [Aestuariicoccus sp. MJ-SS9]|uniref:2-dehydro-3-deoxygalactonokinase n=1 Tax=Aestuariicoccus sp. MJ-SS9 TaxID=3079855 RepID=UPI002914A174|nr:2-dehydro-3-deoxygalactonokinase [Aestuariicoccus sp. MJ-SS9]MDU8910633.1 2-dehydro-3-deoxygalactonokinase [Aestuariicoccus sp. MJ-SS9]
MTTADWIAVDWGTTHLRVWAMGPGGQVLARHDSDEGMGALARDGYEPALLRLIGEALPERGRVPVIVCGMAGSRQGWAEAPYTAVPCQPPGGADARQVPTADARLDVRILPGVKQPQPADVMRGEETQVAGFLALNPKFDGVICLPGTHSKWVHVSAGEIVSFRTFMTGELFSLLSRQSVLRHSVGEEGWDDAAFDAAVTQAMGRPAGFAGDLFGLRAEALLTGLAPETARARLSGLLIGMELSAARPYWLGQAVAILGESALARAYARALEAQGVPATLADAERMTLEGLRAAHASLKETT